MYEDIIWRNVTLSTLTGRIEITEHFLNGVKILDTGVEEGLDVQRQN